MELFIQIRDGIPHQHPIIGVNFKQAFPEVDTDNLPSNFARFERVPPPVPEVYEVVDGPVYQWVNGIVKDVWTVRPMTEAERKIKTQELIDGAYEMCNFLKNVAQSNINASTSETAKQAWADYFAQLNAYVVTDPLNPQFPLPPKILPDGTVLTTTAPGSAPSVTG